MKLKCQILLALTLLAAAIASAHTLSVTSTADSGWGTLRAALASAKDGDRIDATRVRGTIHLTSGELFVGESVVIVGPGPAKLAVDSNFSSRAFHIGFGTVVNLASLTITNCASLIMSLYPYIYGGGIYNDHAVLTVSNCVVTGNLSYGGAGIANDGYSGSATLTIINSFVTANSVPIESSSGGGILNYGENGSATMTVINSTVSDNDAGFLGGGIFNDAYEGSAIMTVVNSTVSGNDAGWSGGGIYNAGWNGTASLTLENSTIAENQAGSGGGVYNAGYSGTASLTITNCAIIGNQSLYYGSGGGLYNGVSGGNATLTLVNSTISGNLAATGGGIYDGNDSDIVPGTGLSAASLQILNSTLTTNSAETIYDANCDSTVEIGSTILKASTSGSTLGFVCPSVISLGYNISSDDGGGVLTNATDKISTDPLLGPLQDNGGPTFTCALLPGSPAIDQGENFSGALYDQRGFGFVRTSDDPSIPNALGGDGTDIGAFEVQTTLNPAQAVQQLLVLIHSQARRLQPLCATLDAALSSIGRNNLTPAISQLAAFQRQVRILVMPSNPVLATELLQAAQDAINALNAERY
jgi:hypothetical protein